MNKKELRKTYKEKRAQLSQDELALYSQKITELLLQSNEFNNQIISLFISIKEQKEIDTSHLLNQLQKHNQIAVSKSDFSTHELELFIYENEQQLEISSYGIPEPTYGKKIQAEVLDVIIVPLLCFDKNGYRTGYGKGFYDRLMAKAKPTCLFIGLSFFEAIERIDDIDKFDQKLDYCITPEKIYKFIDPQNTHE